MDGIKTRMKMMIGRMSQVLKHSLKTLDGHRRETKLVTEVLMMDVMRGHGMAPAAETKK